MLSGTKRSFVGNILYGDVIIQISGFAIMMNDELIEVSDRNNVKFETKALLQEI